jgi:hypothetical protein
MDLKDVDYNSKDSWYNSEGDRSSAGRVIYISQKRGVVNPSNFAKA